MYNPLISGERIKDLRLEKGFTQKELAEKIGITQQAVNLIEHDQRKIDINLYVKISQILDPEHKKMVHLPVSTNDENDSLLSCLRPGDYVETADIQEQELLSDFRELNPNGKTEAIKRVEELTEIRKYRKGQE